MKCTTLCASGDYPNRMIGWLEVSFGADQGGKDRFCQLRQRVVDAHVFAYRGIWAWCTMASRINTRWQPPVTNFPPALLKMLRCSVRHRGEQLDLVIQRLLSTLKIALFYSVAAWLCLCCIWGEGSRYVSYLVQHVQWVKNAEVLLQVIAGMMHCQLIRRHGREDQQSETALWKQSPYFLSPKLITWQVSL